VPVQICIVQHRAAPQRALFLRAWLGAGRRVATVDGIADPGRGVRETVAGLAVERLFSEERVTTASE
jgi:hypothetical protein